MNIIIILNSWHKSVYIDLSVIEVTSCRPPPKLPADPRQGMFYSGPYHGSPARQLSDNELCVWAHALSFGYSPITYSWGFLRCRIITMSGPNNTSIFHFKISVLSKAATRSVPSWLILQTWIKHLEVGKNQRRSELPRFGWKAEAPLPPVWGIHANVPPGWLKMRRHRQEFVFFVLTSVLMKEIKRGVTC